MCIPTSWKCFYRHFQSFSLSVCGSLMLQKIHHCAHAKENKITCLNDWRPVALTPIFSKCFEKLVREHICSVLPSSLDPLQLAYRSNLSTDDAIAFTLHTALSHLENKNTYVRMLFVDYSSAFNTIVSATLVAKLQTLGLNRSLCSCILDFLTGRSQVVRMGNNTSSPLTLNTGAPQGCVLSPLLYSLYTHDSTATHSSNVIFKFANDTMVISLISDNDETRPTERRWVLWLNGVRRTTSHTTSMLCKGSCELPATLLEVSFPPSRTSTPGGVYKEIPEDHQGL